MTTQDKLQREIDQFIANTPVSGQKQADAEEYLPGGAPVAQPSSRRTHTSLSEAKGTTSTTPTAIACSTS